MPDEKSNNPIPPNLPISGNQPATTPTWPSLNSPTATLPPVAPTPLSNKPVGLPTASAPQPPINLSPKPVVPALPTRPVATAPITPTPVLSKEISATVRTMESDIKAVGQNLPSRGVEVKVGGGPIVSVKPPVVPVSTPVVFTPVNSSNVALGPSEKRTTPLSSPVSPAPQKPTPPVAPVGIVLPPVNGSRKIRPLFLGLVLLVLVIGGLGIYWMLAPKVEPVPTPAPTQVVSATPEASAAPGPVDDLNAIFPSHGAITLVASRSTEFVPELYSQMVTVSNTGVKNVFLAPASPLGASETLPFLFTDFVRLSSATDLPTTTNGLDDQNFGLVISRQTEKFTSKGALVPNSPVEQRLALVVGVKDPAMTATWLTAWEGNMAKDLSNLFKLGASINNVVFKNNNYRGLNIRYANFTQPDRSIDYAVVRATNGRSYLVITNSREQVYGVVDNLLGF